MSTLSWGLARMARLSPPETTRVEVERDLDVKMPDGEVLLADRWYAPATAGSAPIVLLRSPYGRRQIDFVGRLIRGARVPDGHPELPRHVRVGRNLRSVPLRSSRRPGHAGVAGGAAVVHRCGWHVWSQLPGPDAMVDRRPRAGVREGNGVTPHGVAIPRGCRVPG